MGAKGGKDQDAVVPVRAVPGEMCEALCRRATAHPLETGGREQHPNAELVLVLEDGEDFLTAGKTLLVPPQLAFASLSPRSRDLLLLLPQSPTSLM